MFPPFSNSCRDVNRNASFVNVQAFPHFKGVTDGCCVLVAESALSFGWEPLESWFLDLMGGPLGR